MKKTKLLIIVLVVSVMLIGAGYAYWTQDLTITNTVSTGDLKVEFIPLALGECIDDHGGYDDELPLGLSPADYMTVGLGFDSDRLEFNIDGIYPGAGGYLRFRIANTGTVPATVTNIVPVVTPGNEVLLNNFDFTIQSLTLYKPINGYAPKDGWKFWDMRYFETVLILPGFGELDLIHAEDFDDFVEQLESRLGSYTLEPGAFWVINGEGTGYNIELPSNFSENTFEGIQDIAFDLNIEFTQGE